MRFVHCVAVGTAVLLCGCADSPPAGNKPSPTVSNKKVEGDEENLGTADDGPGEGEPEQNSGDKQADGPPPPAPPASSKPPKRPPPPRHNPEESPPPVGPPKSPASIAPRLAVAYPVVDPSYKSAPEVDPREEEHLMQRIGESLLVKRVPNTGDWRALGGLSLLRDVIAAIASEESSQVMSIRLYNKLNRIVMLAGELGSQHVFIPSSIAGAICPSIASPGFIRRLHESLFRRFENRKSNLAGSFSYVPMMDSVNLLADHPLAYLDLVCDIRNIPSLQLGVTNHRIGRYLREKYAGDMEPNYVLFGSSFNSDFEMKPMLENIAKTNPSFLQTRVKVVFKNGQEGYLQWLSRVMRRILNPQEGLFEYKNGVYRLVDSTGGDGLRKGWYKAVGRVMGLSILEGIPLGAQFNPAFYKSIMFHHGKCAWTEPDLESDDPVAYKKWKSMVECGKKNTCSDTVFPRSLRSNPNGETVRVNSKNIGLWAQWALTDSLHTYALDQYGDIEEGLADVLPVHLLTDLLACSNAPSLGVILTGNTKVDTADLMDSMTIDGFKDNSTVKKWMHAILEKNGAPFRKTFLQLMTWLRVIPLGGFSEAAGHIQIYNNAGAASGALTVNRDTHALYMPEYSSMEAMERALLKFIKK